MKDENGYLEKQQQMKNKKGDTAKVLMSRLFFNYKIQMSILKWKQRIIGINTNKRRKKRVVTKCLYCPDIVQPLISDTNVYQLIHI